MKRIDVRTAYAIAAHKADPSAHHVKTTEFDIFGKYYDTIRLSRIIDTNAWDQDIVGAGAVADYGSYIYLSAGLTPSDHIFVTPVTEFQELIPLGKSLTVEWLVASLTTVNSTQYLWFCNDNSVPPAGTESHFGFKIINGRVWATNGDDDTQKITDTGYDITTTWPRLKVVVNQGENVKFYINGVLKATHTVNLPLYDENYYPMLGVVTAGAPGANMYISRILMERDYT